MLEGMYGSTRSNLTPLLLLGTGIALFPLDGVTETRRSMCLFEWKWFLSLLICFLFDIIFHFIAPKILRPRQQHHQGWHVQTTNKKTGQRQNLPLSPFSVWYFSFLFCFFLFIIFCFSSYLRMFEPKHLHPHQKLKKLPKKDTNRHQSHFCFSLCVNLVNTI